MNITATQIAYGAVGAVIGGAGLTVMLPLALPVIGFSAIGPGAGTIAASAMSMYAGAVPAAGVVATAQSIAMAGAGLGTAVTGALSGSVVGVLVGKDGKDVTAQAPEAGKGSKKSPKKEKKETWWSKLV